MSTNHTLDLLSACRRPRRLAGLLIFLTALLGLLPFLERSPSVARAEPPTDRLTSRPRPTPHTARPLAVGEEVRTAAHEQRRLALPDGSLLYVNEKSAVTLAAQDHLTLSAGEVFVEAKPDTTLTVQTPQRQVSLGAGTAAVSTQSAGTGVLVTRGEAKVGADTVVLAGQQLPPGAVKAVAAPRASHLLDWTRELMVAAESPLVPQSPYAGGALVAVDPNGQEARLSLRQYHIDVHIEDGFARTTIDQTYFNHETARLEGTFYFPLPPDASLSRLAMYVDGRLMEGGMAERDHARSVYETILFQQRDPALLEWVDGSTFKMRVFPLEPRQEKRILLSYTQKLPSLYGQAAYRFAAGDGGQSVAQWSFHARIKQGAGLAWSSPSHRLQATHDGYDLLLDATEQNVRADRDVTLTLTDGADDGGGEATHLATTEQDGARYLMLRYRPALPGEARKQRRDWVFLFESSGDRDPLLARTQIDVIQGLLAQAEAEDTFTVLAAGTRVHSCFAELRPVTSENVRQAVTFLEGSHLIGALDLGHALKETAHFLQMGKNPYLVHVGSGIAALGERRDDVLAKSLPAGARYVGIGVGRRWARSFMKAAAEHSGGYFTQINPDESVSWRTFDLAATLNTPRLLDVQVVDQTGRARFLTDTVALAQGEELSAIARLPADATPLPEKITVRGTVEGQPFEKMIAVQEMTRQADYLPRTWAKWEIDRLLAADPVKNKDQVVALSKAMYVMTPFTSLLVLENEDLYEQYKVDRGRKDHWAMYPAPDRIAVVKEGANQKPSPKQVRETVLLRPEKGLQRWLQDMVERRRLEFERLKARKEDTVVRHLGTFEHQPIAVEGFWDTDRTPPEVHGILDLGTLPNLKRPSDGRPSPGDSLAVDFMSSPEIKPRDVSGPGPREQDQIRLGDPNRRLTELLHNSEDLRPIESEWERTRSSEPPSLWSAERVHGGIDDGFVNSTTGEEVWQARQRDNRWEGIESQTALPAAGGDASLLYHRPVYSGEDRLFFDLLRYTPGMNTSLADIRAVVEAEAAPDPQDRIGHIDPGARALLDRARAAGWQKLTVTDGDSKEAKFSITFDGSGRYAWDRTLPFGLHEHVVCDGQTLLHLYPDLGIGARRTVSRFHHTVLAEWVPWSLPSAEDLAHEADLELIGERTVSVVPHAAHQRPPDTFVGPVQPPVYLRLDLVFAEDGRLAERHLVAMPDNQLLERETYAADGTVKRFDGAGKELEVRRATLQPAEAPDLQPDVKKLVVLPLPYRSPEHVRKVLKIENQPLRSLRFADALALFAAHVGADNANEAHEVFREAFHDRNQRQIGFYVLLAATGQNLDAEHEDVLAEHPDEPLAQYLALYSSPVLRRHASGWAVRTGLWTDPFLEHLAVSHALLQRWGGNRSGGSEAQPQAERDRALAYVRRNKGTLFGWTLLCLMQDRAGDDATFHRALADAWSLFADVPDLEYFARYEQARSLWKGGERQEARQCFIALYQKTLAEDSLPLIDGDFRTALLSDGREEDAWGPLLQQTARRLAERNQRPAVLVLAQQCWQLGDQALANELAALALDRLPQDREQLSLRLAGLAFFWHTNQLEQADRLLQGLLADEEQARRPALWRLAARLAERREQLPRQLSFLERAVELEYHQPPEVILLQAVRNDYGALLDRYQELARAMVTLKIEPPPDFVARVVATADRWRALDRGSEDACNRAARILQTLGGRDLAWDYLTTPIGMQPNEPGPWLALAQNLGQKGDLELADRAFAAAYEAEPTNAQILWDRAQHLRRAGKRAESDRLLRQLAEGTWQPRFQWLQTQARSYLKAP